MPTKFISLSLGNAALYLSACMLIGTGLLLEIRNLYWHWELVSWRGCCFGRRIAPAFPPAMK